MISGPLARGTGTNFDRFETNGPLKSGSPAETRPFACLAAPSPAAYW